MLRNDARASRAIVNACASRSADRRLAGATIQHARPRVSSAMRAITLHQDPPPLLVGERVNSQGSRKVKRCCSPTTTRESSRSRASRWIRRARARRLRRAHRARRRSRADVEGRQAAVDERRDAAHDRLDRANVIEAALEHIPGRAIVNSINMENGRKRIDAVVPLAKKHGAALIALTIDEIGMAKTRERKLEVAKKIYDIVVGEYGLAPEDLIYDALTFTLATGDAEWIDSASRRSKASASSSASCRASSPSSASRTSASA
jgi:5-methyltetrahydrofolate--homocysteine methyltransferase